VVSVPWYIAFGKGDHWVLKDHVSLLNFVYF
jgi:hypothetical protein